MVENLELTSWSGMRVRHPPEWEVSHASAPDAPGSRKRRPAGAESPGRLTFADRRRQRLELRWRTLRNAPNLELMLRKHMEGSDRRESFAPLTGAPAGWKGLVEKLSDGCITHAGRFFDPPRVLVEATLVWPDRRDERTERGILESVRPEGPSPRRLWQAMGLTVTLGEQFLLRQYDARTGRVRWVFRHREKANVELAVERIAMARYWLRGELTDWLAGELPEGSRIVSIRRTRHNGHVAGEVVSRQRGNPLANLLGAKRERLDLAWQCPADERVYHVLLAGRPSGEELRLPDCFELYCCNRRAAEGVVDE